MYWLSISGGQSFSFSISLFNEYSGLISFRMDWLDLFAGVLQGVLKNLFSVPPFEDISFLALSLFYCPALTSVHDCWKNHSFDYTDLCSKVMSLLFNRSVIAFLPRSKHLLISWLQSPSAVILEPKKRKSVTVSIVSPIYMP